MERGAGGEAPCTKKPLPLGEGLGWGKLF